MGLLQALAWSDMDLAEHFRAIARNWWRILLVAVFVAGVTYGVSHVLKSVYESNTVLSVTAGGAQNGTVSAKDQTPFLASTYAQLATSNPVLTSAAKNSGLGISEKTAEARVSASTSSGLGFVTVTATGPSQHDAAALANAVAHALVVQVTNEQNAAVQGDLASVNQQINTLAAQLNSLPANSPQTADLQTRYNALLQAAVQRQTDPRDRVDVLSAATTSSNQIAPKPTQNALLAFVIAIIIVAELSVALRAWGDRFSVSNAPEEIADSVGYPLLGAIPVGKDHQVVEAFRTLRTNIMLASDADASRSIAIVSANPNAGKTFVSVNLARAASAVETRVVLIDGDLRRPTLHLELQTPMRPGLTDILHRRPDDAAKYLIDRESNLRLLPSGAPASDPVGLLGGRSFALLIDALAGPQQLLIVDTPPVGLFADALNIAVHCDAVIFVIDIKTSRRRAVRRSLKAFSQSGARVLGVVVNRVPVRKSEYGRYYSEGSLPAGR
jgi:succinoglycan biosynthesis transport protein ExoP